MDPTGESAEERQDQVNPEVPAEAGDQEDGQRRKKERQDDQHHAPQDSPRVAVGVRAETGRGRDRIFQVVIPPLGTGSVTSARLTR